MAKLAILGNFDSSRETHVVTNQAILHTAIEVNADWIPTDTITPELLSKYHGIWLAPGPPYNDLDRVLKGVAFAREKCLPTLGTCQGFQTLILEYARNVLGISDAAHEEYSPKAADLIITKLQCSLAGSEMNIMLRDGAHIAKYYGKASLYEKYYCNFGINPDYLDAIFSQKLHVVGTDQEGEARIVQLEDHPFFVGTLFVPQASSTSEEPHPLVRAFLRAVCSEG